jgi:hypothetical protein
MSNTGFINNPLFIHFNSTKGLVGRMSFLLNSGKTLDLRGISKLYWLSAVGGYIRRKAGCPMYSGSGILGIYRCWRFRYLIVDANEHCF